MLFVVRRWRGLGLRNAAAVLLLAAGAGVGRAWGAEAILVADAHVNSAMPAVNSGAISNLNVGGGYTALLQFDLSMLPAGTTSARFGLSQVGCSRWCSYQSYLQSYTSRLRVNRFVVRLCYGLFVPRTGSSVQERKYRRDKDQRGYCGTEQATDDGAS